MTMNNENEFNAFRQHFSEVDRQITLAQFRALSLDELNALIVEAKLTRPNAGQARLFHGKCSIPPFIFIIVIVADELFFIPVPCDDFFPIPP